MRHRAPVETPVAAPTRQSLGDTEIQDGWETCTRHTAGLLVLYASPKHYGACTQLELPWSGEMATFRNDVVGES